jgi:hypothetical protein
VFSSQVVSFTKTRQFARHPICAFLLVFFNLLTVGDDGEVRVSETYKSEEEFV